MELGWVSLIINGSFKDAGSSSNYITSEIKITKDNKNNKLKTVFKEVVMA
jgi:hypothetical protein